jgi:hypothetical protein
MLAPLDMWPIVGTLRTILAAGRRVTLTQGLLYRADSFCRDSFTDY